MNQTVRFIAEFMDGINRQTGTPVGEIRDQAERAARRAKLDPALVEQAATWLDKQDRV